MNTQFYNVITEKSLAEITKETLDIVEFRMDDLVARPHGRLSGHLASFIAIIEMRKVNLDIKYYARVGRKVLSTEVFNIFVHVILRRDNDPLHETVMEAVEVVESLRGVFRRGDLERLSLTHSIYSWSVPATITMAPKLTLDAVLEPLATRRGLIPRIVLQPLNERSGGDGARSGQKTSCRDWPHVADRVLSPTSEPVSDDTSLAQCCRRLHEMHVAGYILVHSGHIEHAKIRTVSHFPDVSDTGRETT